ncbi:MAG: hypothetical protein ACC635_01960 [Acidiferrobacterales bacterium]
MAKKNNKEAANDLENGQCNGREAIQQAVLNITSAAKREYIIMGPVLDPRIFNRPEFIEALTTFVTGHPRNITKILIENSNQVINENGRLITLCRRLSENLRIRTMPEEYQGQSDLFLVADNETLLFQKSISSPVAIVTKADKTVAAPYKRRFDYAWQHSIPVPGLHTLGL